MGSFLRRFKYHLVLGRLFGFVFFSNENKNGSFIDLCWIVPFGIFYFYATVKGVIVLPAILVNEALPVADFGLVTVAHLTLISRSIYYFVQKNRFQKLLKKLDELDDRLETIEADQNEGTKLQYFVPMFLLISAVDVISCCVRKFSFFLYFLYTTALSVFLLHEFFVNEMLRQHLQQIRVVNRKFSLRSEFDTQNRMMTLLEEAVKSYWEFAGISKEANDFFGFVILMDTNLSLAVLIVTVYLLKSAGTNHDFPMALRLHTWTLVTLVIMFWSTKLWTSIEREVRYFKLQRNYRNFHNYLLPTFNWNLTAI